MLNYKITKNTVAILKQKRQTKIFDVNNSQVFNIGIKSLLEKNCNYYDTSLNLIKKRVKSILNIQYKVPIIIGDNILIQLNSLKCEDAIFLMLDKIIDYQYYNNILHIYCVNNNVFKLKISLNQFEKILVKAIKLNNILKYQKMTNLL